MVLLAVSDLHGNLDSVDLALERIPADALLCCGDWGDPGEVELADLERFASRLPVLSAFGNHDNLDALRAVRNRDGTPCLIETGEVRRLGPYMVGAINGIWAKSNRLPYYITDEQVAEAAERLATAAERLDILLTHGCPAGVADLTQAGRHGGQRCFLDALRRVRPRLHLCGHLHRLQEQRTGDGLHVVNLGATPSGDTCRIEKIGEELQVELVNYDNMIRKEADP